jgi:Ca2+-binding RTX toxin-like protein
MSKQHSKSILATDGDDSFIFNITERAHSLGLHGGNDVVIDRSFADDRIFGGDGDDIIVTTAGHDTIAGTRGGDLITVQANQYSEQVVVGGEIIIERHGFNVTVRGGRGHDVLTVDHSKGYTMQTDLDGTVHIDTPKDEHITAHGIEEFHFV